MAALWPDRCKAIVSVSGYLISISRRTRAVAAAGRVGVVVSVLFRDGARRARLPRNRREFNKLIWSSRRRMDVRRCDIRSDRGVVQQPGPCQHRHSQLPLAAELAKGEPRYDALEASSLRQPAITVPAITIASDFDGAAATAHPMRSDSRASTRIGSSRHRAQRAAGSATGLRQSGDRRRRVLRGARLARVGSTGAIRKYLSIDDTIVQCVGGVAREKILLARRQRPSEQRMPDQNPLTELSMTRLGITGLGIAASLLLPQPARPARAEHAVPAGRYCSRHTQRERSHDTA